jgi:hypothetical protein
MLQITSYTPIRFTAEPLAYLGVAESPDTIDKETREVLGENPHINLIMKWQVPFKHFAAWALWIEALWGHGFAHLEKIKDPQYDGDCPVPDPGEITPIGFERSVCPPSRTSETCDQVSGTPVLGCDTWHPSLQLVRGVGMAQGVNATAFFNATGCLGCVVDLLKRGDMKVSVRE